MCAYSKDMQSSSSPVSRSSGDEWERVSPLHSSRSSPDSLSDLSSLPSLPGSPLRMFRASSPALSDLSSNDTTKSSPPPLKPSSSSSSSSSFATSPIWVENKQESDPRSLETLEHVRKKLEKHLEILRQKMEDPESVSLPSTPRCAARVLKRSVSMPSVPAPEPSGSPPSPPIIVDVPGDQTSASVVVVPVVSSTLEYPTAPPVDAEPPKRKSHHLFRRMSACVQWIVGCGKTDHFREFTDENGNIETVSI